MIEVVVVLLIDLEHDPQDGQGVPGAVGVGHGLADGLAVLRVEVDQVHLHGGPVLKQV